MNTIKKYILAAICLTIGISMQAQLKVGSNSNIGIGTDPTVTEKLSVEGSSYFNGESYFKTYFGGGFQMSHRSYLIKVGGLTRNQLIPILFSNNANFSGALGTYDYPFYEIRGTNIYYTSLIQGSDMKLKTNIKKAPDFKDKLNKINVYQYDLNEKNFKYQDDEAKAASMNK